jgi:hypothetical protein
MAAHLEANGINPANERLTLGPILRMNPRSEKFKGSSLANRLLTRDYRAPFVVPNRV